MKIKIAIVEDDKNYNNALKKIINFQSDMEVVSQFFTGNDALLGLPKTNADVVLMDIQLQDILGIEVIFKIKSEMPLTQFLMCTSFEDDEKIFASLKAGATGYLLKGESMEKILTSIREVNLGGSPMSFGVARKVLKYFEKTISGKDDVEDLTTREKEVLELLSHGLLYKEIADKICISVDTAKKHIGNIYRKLHVNNKIEAINKLNQIKH